jgi:hypothetical protein
MKVARQAPMGSHDGGRQICQLQYYPQNARRFHDVAVVSAIYYPHREGV